MWEGSPSVGLKLFSPWSPRPCKGLGPHSPSIHSLWPALPTWGTWGVPKPTEQHLPCRHLKQITPQAQSNIFTSNLPLVLDRRAQLDYWHLPLPSSRLWTILLPLPPSTPSTFQVPIGLLCKHLCNPPSASLPCPCLCFPPLAPPPPSLLHPEGSL